MKKWDRKDRPVRRKGNPRKVKGPVVSTGAKPAGDPGAIGIGASAPLPGFKILSS